jgi:hypothetical protein
VTCVATSFGFVRIEEELWKPWRQRAFVYVALTVGCLFSRQAGGEGMRCGEDLLVRLGWLLCNISGLLPMSRFASAFPKRNGGICYNHICCPTQKYDFVCEMRLVYGQKTLANRENYVTWKFIVPYRWCGGGMAMCDE